MDKYYTCEEVAEIYKVKVKTVWSWVKSGKLPAVKLGRYIRIRQSDLLRFEQESN